MPAPKGHARYGGREKGTPNKSTTRLRELAEKHKCDPFEVLLMFAKGDYQGLGYEKERTVSVSEFGEVRELTISPELRQKSAKDACKFLEPELKAIDHGISDETAAKIVSYEEYLKTIK